MGYEIVIEVREGRPVIRTWSTDIPEGYIKIGGHEDQSGNSINIVRTDLTGRHLAEAQHYYKPENYEERPHFPVGPEHLPPVIPAVRYVGEQGGQGSNLARREIGHIGSDLPDWVPGDRGKPAEPMVHTHHLPEADVDPYRGTILPDGTETEGLPGQLPVEQGGPVEPVENKIERYRQQFIQGGPASRQVVPVGEPLNPDKVLDLGGPVHEDDADAEDSHSPYDIE